GSPLINGTTDLHVRLEAELCRVMGVEACALFSTGFQTNVGAIGCLVGEGDVVFSDSRNHASIVEGCRLAKGEVRPFRHNDLSDLETQLAAEPGRAKLIVIDGVYSMGGDLAELPGVVMLARRYGARLLVDDAHGFGVLGPGGRGTGAHFGLSHQVDLTMVTFSKALGTVGGCLLGPASVIHYVKHRARSYVFSAAMPPGNVAATLTSLGLLVEGDALRQRLWENVRQLREGLAWLGFRLGCGEHHIIAVEIGDDDVALRMTRQLREAGVFVSGIVQPGVGPGEAMLRVTPMATHTPAEIGRALAVFAGVGRECGLIR
ncbi:MAG: pyridoxal phosphate-dependent aminotransferase family protein, partial [Candidatus Sericytochromatia bacterium]|nr:pyridoxal phosphate-dependent aminotransferase family protein [Candidatus Sericytochromatia bacterium]